MASGISTVQNVMADASATRGPEGLEQVVLNVPGNRRGRNQAEPRLDPWYYAVFFKLLWIVACLFATSVIVGTVVYFMHVLHQASLRPRPKEIIVD
ncbi:unnamed protein product [Ceutorhynchus assimilis]|uniref:Uncharacterized protein n=1 Tax=Ceutorhynchus assimilis TaxID=467358 RepID=A0A9N9MEF5_9CUCU|nr:unnamed protein product [Ceutorhynchus assimilis]